MTNQDPSRQHFPGTTPLPFHRDALLLPKREEGRRWTEKRRRSSRGATGRTEHALAAGIPEVAEPMGGNPCPQPGGLPTPTQTTGPLARPLAFQSRQGQRRTSGPPTGFLSFALAVMMACIARNPPSPPLLPVQYLSLHAPALLLMPPPP